MIKDYQQQFEGIKSGILSSLRGYFPVSGKRHQLILDDIWVDDSVSIRDFEAQTEAYNKKSNFAVPVYAAMTLKDISGATIDKTKKIKILSLPKITSRGTYMLSGNEYQIPYQLRLKPNVYNRIKENGELETFINIKPVALHLYLDPEKATFSLQFGSQKKVSLYPFLIGLGVSDADMSVKWGEDVLGMNKKARGNPQGEVEKFFEMAYNRAPMSSQEAVTGVLAYLDGKALDAEGTKLTLGVSHSKLSTQVIIDSASKLINLNKKTEEPDERDAVHFKRVAHVEDFLTDRLENEKRKLLFKIKQRLDSKDTVRDVLKADLFDAPIHSFFTSSSSSNHANTLNPLSMMAESNKITIMGEGGIEDENAITEEARAVHPSQLGFIDPIHTPEGGNIGSVNQIALMTDKVGGELVSKMHDARTSRVVNVTPIQASQSVISFADQFEVTKSGLKARYPMVKASIRNRMGMIDPKDVDFVMMNDKQVFSFASNMTPFINHISGNRSMMSGKHMEQALPLKFREAPLVQNKLMEGVTFEQKLSEEVEAQSDLSGVVKKITKDNISIEGKDGVVEHPIYNRFISPSDKVYTHHDPIVAVGDKVKKGQTLTESNYSKDKTYAVGANLNVAFTPYKGYTFEDGVAISESAAKKLTSLHMYKEKVEIDANSILDKKQFLSYFPTKITGENMAKLGDDAVIKEGSVVRTGDYMIAHLHKEDYTKEDMLIASFNKRTLKPYKDRSLIWEEDFEGKVVRVIRRPREIEVQVETEESARIGDKLCYDEQTDVLTSTGWKRVSDITLEDEVCCLDRDNIIYLKPESTHKYDSGGKMYKIESQQIDLLVTENHNMYVQRRDKKYFELIKAKDVYGKRVSYKKNGNWTGKDIHSIKLPTLTVAAGQGGVGTRDIPEKELLIDDYMFLLGCFLSEGSIFNYKKKGGYGIKIEQRKPEGRRLIEEELVKRNIKHHKFKNNFVVVSKQVMTLFSGFGKACDKYIPNWVFNLPPDRLKTLFKWLMWGDGHSDFGRYINYTTTSKKLADDIQRLCLHIGISANYKQKSGFRWEKIKGIFYFCKPIYDVRIIVTKNTPTVNHGHVKKQKIQTEGFVEEYSNPVYCVTVSTGVLYVRRNGKPVFCGNSGRSGNKGIITHIIPDNEVPVSETGNKIDMFLNPHGVVGRINPAQILETYAGKIADKTGIPYVVDNFSGTNYHEKITNELKTLGIPEKELIKDQSGNTVIENPIAVGKMHVLKLNHPVRKKFQAREDRAYTIDMQPTSGGGEGGRKMDQLSIYSLLSHGATSSLRESMTYKGEKNDDFWHAYQAGLPLPKPKVPFVFDKFQAMLKASGINMERRGDQFQAMPLTGEDIKKMSNGEILEPEFIQGKNLNAIKGGLFDPNITGGREGTKWSHISLAEELPNPVFEGAILSVLELKKEEYDDIIAGKKYVDSLGLINSEARGLTGGPAIAKLLKKINIDSQLNRLGETIKVAEGSELNRLHKKIRYLKALKKLDEPATVYMSSNVPVLPPIFRPITPGEGNRLNIQPANTLYRDLMLINNQLKKSKENNLPDSEISELRKNLYEAYGSLVGTEKGMTDVGQKEQAGFLQLIAGKKPKEGFFQDKMLSKRQDFSGTSTVTPEPSYGLDNIGIPYEMLWSIYKPHVVRRLQQLGYTPNAAIKEVEERSTLAKSVLDQETASRPVVINRAPSLHKFSLLAFKPRPVEGKAIKVNPLIVGGFNMDFDGDSQIVKVYISANINKIQKIFDFSKKSDYINFREFALQRKVKMPSKVKIPIKKGESILHVDLEDFPRIESSKRITEKGTIIYSVPEGISVYTCDNITKKPVLVPVIEFSIHPNLLNCVAVFSDGNENMTSDDHSLIAINMETGILEPVNPYDAFRRAIPKIRDINPEISINKIRLIDYAGKSNNVQSRVIEEIGLTEELGHFIGMMVGDGWIDCSKAICFSNISPILGEAFSGMINVLVGKEIPTKLDDNPHEFEGFKCESKKYTKFSNSLSGNIISWIGQGAHNKHLPPFFMSTPEEFRLGLLAGLIDTDGSSTWIKAKIKKSPQYGSWYSTVSERLATEILTLCRSLGITASITPTKKEYRVVFSASTIHDKRILLRHPNKAKALLEYQAKPIPEYSLKTKMNDSVPFSRDLFDICKKYKTFKSHYSLYITLAKYSKLGLIPRWSAQQLIDIPGLPEWWIKIVKDMSITWVTVVECRKNSRRVTMYDITAPGPYTFMTDCGIVVQDSVGVHVPISDEAVKESHKMLASNNLFDPQNWNVIHQPKSEQITGLYMMTTPGDVVKKSYKSFEEAIAAYKAGEIKVNSVVTVKGKKLTLGLALVNNVLPEKYRDYDNPLDGKRLKQVLNEIAKNESGQYAVVVSHLKDLGNEAIDKLGLTAGLSDLKVDYKERDALVAEANKIVAEGGSVDSIVNRFDKFTSDSLKKSKSSLSTMLESGGSSKQSAIRQMVSTPFITTDHRNKPIPLVIDKSYTEGLDAGSYFSTLSGARKGMMDRALSTKEPGAFTKDIINTVIGTVVREQDCGTHNGIEVPVKEKAHIVGRYTTEGQLVDDKFLKNYKGDTIKLRSPLTCESLNPPCAKCFGHDETGKTPQMGTYLGTIAGQSMTEPTTQLVLRKFHTGGALSGNTYESDTFHKGFDRVQEILNLPKILRDKATLSSVSGIVNDIKIAPQGGWFVYINNTEHYIPGQLNVAVKLHQKIEKGDRLSSGAIKPQELSGLTSPLNAKRYMVNELSRAYQEQGRTIRKPLIETVVSSLVSKGQVTDSGTSEYTPGDYVNINKMDALNKQGEKIKYLPVFSGLNQAPLHDEDFIARLNFQRLKDTLVEAPAQGWVSSLKGPNPIPGLVYGAEFGKASAKKKDPVGLKTGEKDTSPAVDATDSRVIIPTTIKY